MSECAFIIVRDEDDVVCYTNSWTPSSIATDAALDGLESTLMTIRSSPWELSGALSAPEEFDRWIEGCLLIDRTVNELTWFEEDLEGIPPRLLNCLLEESWAGWTATWAPEGIIGILRKLHIDASRINRDPEPKMNIDEIPWAGPADSHDDLDSVRSISVRLSDGELVAWASEIDLFEIGSCGADDVINFARNVRETMRTGLGQETHAGAESRNALLGVHIDAATRTLRWWTNETESFGFVPYQEYWPGFSLEVIGDNYEWQEEQVGGLPLCRAWGEVLADSHRRLAGRVPGRLRAEHGQRVGIVFDVLSALVADGRPLPPARYIGSDGCVHDPRDATESWWEIDRQPKQGRSIMTEMLQIKEQKHRERAIRSDTDYDSPHREFWHLDVQGLVSPEAAVIRDVLRGIRFAGHAWESTNPMLAGQCAMTVELATGHWLELQCFFDQIPTSDTLPQGDLIKVVTVMTEHPSLPVADRIHRFSRQFDSADDDPPLPLGFQYSGGLLMHAIETSRTASARAMRTIVRALWETCFHADVFETFAHWFMGLDAFEVNLSTCETAVIDGRRWFGLGFEYIRWEGTTISIDVPLCGNDVNVMISNHAPIDTGQGFNETVRDLCSLLGLGLPDGDEPQKWLVLQLQEIAHDCYYGRVQQAAFDPSARS